MSFKILKYHVETVENCLRNVRISMCKFHPPDGFDFSKSQLWTDWKQRRTRYYKAAELGRKNQEVQISSLIYAIGKKGELIYNQFKCDAPQNPAQKQMMQQQPKRNQRKRMIMCSGSSTVTTSRW